jgi:hypothetical protein
MLPLQEGNELLPDLAAQVPQAAEAFAALTSARSSTVPSLRR